MRTKRQSLMDLVRQRFPEMSEREIKARILRGQILVDEREARSAHERVAPGQQIRIRGLRRYVSRGGDKLAAAITAWDLTARGLIFIDAGSSTGGFTDCLLQEGARLVYAVDVGKNLLAYTLRMNPAVMPLEGRNVLSLSAVDFTSGRPHAAVCDLSFRSLRGAARHLLQLVSLGWMVALAKPQFEWHNPPPTFRGVVHETAHIRMIMEQLTHDLAGEGVCVEGLIASPIRGRRGNREFLLLLSLEGSPPVLDEGRRGDVSAALERALAE